MIKKINLWKYAVAVVCSAMCLTTADAARYEWVGMNGLWSDANNWKDGKLPDSSDTYPSVVYEGSDNIEITIDQPFLSDLGEIYMLSSTAVLNINAQLSVENLMSNGRVNCSSNVFVHGLYVMENDASFYLNGNNLTLVAGMSYGQWQNGIMRFVGNTKVNLGGGSIFLLNEDSDDVPKSRIEVAAMCDLYVTLSDNFSKTSDRYEVFTRVLMEDGTNENLNEYVGRVANFNFTDQDGNKMNKVDDALVADKEHLGSYRVYVDGNDLKVDYVRAVPEPTAATLGLLAFSCLLMRRKRSFQVF